MAQAVLISGGIGSGKSVVARILKTWQYPVYDCDTEAKRLMDTDITIKQAIADNICPDIIRNNAIDRRLLAQHVFADDQKLSTLNRIVHGAVRADLTQWISAHSDRILFIESAIPVTGGLASVAGQQWLVTAPLEIRVERVMKRNNLTAGEVEARIGAQKNDEQPLGSIPCHIIVNDGRHALLPQIQSLISAII